VGEKPRRKNRQWRSVQSIIGATLIVLSKLMNSDYFIRVTHSLGNWTDWHCRQYTMRRPSQEKNDPRSDASMLAEHGSVQITP